VNEFCVRADRNDLRARFFEFLVLLCQSSEFRRSDKGEVRGIKEEDGPLLGCFLSGKREFSEITLGLFKCFEFEIGDTLTNTDTAAVTRHDRLLLSFTSTVVTSERMKRRNAFLYLPFFKLYHRDAARMVPACVN
jgi:hypothetical protein